ncbi:MAG TPA: glycosyltransferase family 4 protein [Bacteroidales bacterium]|nr:glycosyltransferase family 4 protein [Bacteroidales bacterium]
MCKIALIGTYPPRRCGIASFTKDLNDGLKKAGVRTLVVAVNDGLKTYDYPEDVQFEIEQNDLSSYIQASSFLNMNEIDAVILQHEYGIFGGSYGGHILQLLKRLRMPVITTLHTILDTPVPEQKYLLDEICRFSDKVVSISKKGADLLSEIYSIDRRKIVHIHHGVPEISVYNTSILKQSIGAKGKKVLLTFGLISRNKTIEVVIKALPEVIRQHPDTLYIVLGATHPHVIKSDGEEYRHFLIRLVNKLGLEKNVVFIDRYVTNQELFEFLNACDIYIVPYSGEKQISSGTLIYAMSAGKPVISTPFWYARELLTNNRGILFEFNNSEQLAGYIIELLNDEVKRKTIGKNALEFARECYWPKIGERYLEQIKIILKETEKSASEYQVSDDRESRFSLPPLNLNQLKVLTDYTGILQHARYNVPDRSHGYCLDDNTRALILSVMLQDEIQETDELMKLTSIYLSFIDYAMNPENGKFRNYMSYDRRWLESEGSEDSYGRTMWALGYTTAHSRFYNFYLHAKALFEKGLEKIGELGHPRAIAYLLLGLSYYYQKHDNGKIRNILNEKAGLLSSFFNKTIDNSEWIWFENRVTYASTRIPQALITAGYILDNESFVSRGIKILDWLIEKQFVNNIFSPIGNNGWLTPEGKARFDQQPLEAHSMIDACLMAEQVTKSSKYADFAIKAFAWFTGENDCSACLYDFATGGCRDGLTPEGVNLNQGAESTLSWLISLVNISHYLRSRNN